MAAFSKVAILFMEFLINIYDEADSGHLSPGKYFRIAYDRVNVAKACGLNLIPVAEDLTNPVSPPAGEIYIDPKLGKFVLPRPSY